MGNDNYLRGFNDGYARGYEEAVREPKQKPEDIAVMEGKSKQILSLVDDILRAICIGCSEMKYREIHTLCDSIKNTIKTKCKCQGES